MDTIDGLRSPGRKRSDILEGQETTASNRSAARQDVCRLMPRCVPGLDALLLRSDEWR